MKRKTLAISLIMTIGLCFVDRTVAAAPTTPVPPPVVQATGVAVYGWTKGKPTVLYEKKQHFVFPIASITKLVTAKAIESLYGPTKTFTISPTAFATYGSTKGIVAGATFTRDDLFHALLISSSNDAATAFFEATKGATFLATMNNILHKNKYTSTSFTNDTGLDPAKKTIKPNRMTPYNVSRLLSDIYRTDPFLTNILSQKKALITDQSTGEMIEVRSSNELNYDPLYADRVIMSKTGKTTAAREAMVFVTNGYGTFDYITVGLFDSPNRYEDGKVILDWLELKKGEIQ